MAKSALRTLEILEFVARQTQGCTHATVSRELDIPKSSLTALMRDLQTMGYVQLDEATGRFELGSQVLTLSQAYLKGLNLVRLGQPVVTEVFIKVNEFTALAVPKGNDYVLICAEAPPSPLAHSLQIGEHGPLYCSASGKALLALADQGEARQLLQAMPRPKLTPSTKTDVAKIMKEYPAVRSSGLAYAREEAIAGITAMAVPIFNAAGKPVAALSCALPSARLTAVLEKQIATALKAGGEQLSQALGWRQIEERTPPVRTAARR